MKKILFRIVGAVVLLVIVALVVVFFSLNSIVKKGVETVGPQLTKVQIRLEKASLSPFSGRGQLTGLFVGNPEGFKTPSAIQIGDIKIGLQPSSVMADTVVIDLINIQAPEITLEESMQGSNLQKILDNLSSGSSGAEKPKAEQPEKKSEKRFCVKDVLIQGGKVKFSATVLQGKVLPVNLPEIHLQQIGTPEKGVTAGELSTEIMKNLVASATKVAKEALLNGGNLGKDTLDKATDAAKGLKNLLPK
jgi:hypothetical protein